MKSSWKGGIFHFSTRKQHMPYSSSHPRCGQTYSSFWMSDHSGWWPDQLKSALHLDVYMCITGAASWVCVEILSVSTKGKKSDQNSESPTILHVWRCVDKTWRCFYWDPQCCPLALPSSVTQIPPSDPSISFTSSEKTSQTCHCLLYTHSHGTRRSPFTSSHQRAITCSFVLIDSGDKAVSALIHSSIPSTSHTSPGTPRVHIK